LAGVAAGAGGSGACGTGGCGVDWNEADVVETVGEVGGME